MRYYQPNPACSCGRCSTRGLMGPAVLITIGLLFLLANTSEYSFERTWPILLIVIGAIKVGRYVMTDSGHVNPGNIRRRTGWLMGSIHRRLRTRKRGMRRTEHRIRPRRMGQRLRPNRHRLWAKATTARYTMASPVGYYMPPPRRRSVVGPLILIVIGALFLLRNFGYTIPLFTNFASTGLCCWC